MLPPACCSAILLVVSLLHGCVCLWCELWYEGIQLFKILEGFKRLCEVYSYSYHCMMVIKGICKGVRK